MRLRSSWLLALLFAAACSEGADSSPAVTRGRKVYLNNCTACHARDPALPGPVGPPVAGSSLELLRAKVLRNEYPPGHVPLRETNNMIPLPHLEPELDALAAFLATAQGDAP